MKLRYIIGGFIMEQIETLYDNINKKETQRYFKEVLISYQNGSYRSAVVMLYSVVISDILYKLKDMDSIFDDSNAKKILQWIKEEQDRNPNSSEWEKELIKKVKSQTKLIDALLFENINHLRQQRHLSAHPIIDKNDLLISPSREDVIAHIRNMLEQLFVKPSMFTKDVEMHFIIDLGEKQEFLIDDVQLKRYIKRNYLEYFDDYTYKKIFEILWKFTFELNDENGKKNRGINYRTLDILFDDRKELLTGELKNTYYQKHISFDNESTFQILIKFIAKNNIFNYFDEFTKQSIEKCIQDNENLSFISYFLNGDVFKHLEEINNKVRGGDCCYNEVNDEYTKILYEVCKNEGIKEDFLNLTIMVFSKSDSFDRANDKFNSYIKPFILDFYESQLKNILYWFNEVGQINSRRRAERDLKMIVIELKNRGVIPEKDQYPHLNEMLSNFEES